MVVVHSSHAVWTRLNYRHIMTGSVLLSAIFFTGCGQVGFVVDKVALGQVFS
jgi:hypothetical protein